MKMLTMRGVGLNEKLKNYTLIETHPRTVQKMLGIEEISQYLNDRYDVRVKPSEHELDAYLAALTSVFYLNDYYLN
jgi:uncharacterized protein